jgi:hypothetical protein
MQFMCHSPDGAVQKMVRGRGAPLTENSQILLQMARSFIDAAARETNDKLTANENFC